MKKQIYHITGMDCTECAMKIEKGVAQLPGVETARVDFVAGQLFIEGDTDPVTIRQRVELLGYEVTTKEATISRQKETEPNAAAGFWKFLLKRHETRLALTGGGILLLSILAGFIHIPDYFIKTAQLLALVIAGYPIAKSAMVSLWINHDISINLLMTIAAIGAIILGDIVESATLIFLFAISEALEGFSSDRARRVLNEMTDLVPSHAIRIITGNEETVPVEELQVGDTILIRPGDRIPMDGMVTSGQSAVNQAPITGESIPINKEAGDEVFAGTVNGNGLLTLRISHLAKDTTIQRIIHMVEEAQGVRAPTQRFIDRFAQFYTPAVISLAVLIAAIPPLFLGQPFLNPPGQTGWLYRALALLVVACPCALVISAPVTIVSAITNAARRGILIKGGAFLEALAGINLFAFDKTGTLTHGHPVVTTYRSVDCSNSASSTGCCTACDDVLALASALELRSNHPLARSVVAAAETQGLVNHYQPAETVLVLAGSGLQGQVNGKLATIGNHALFDREHPHQPDLCKWVNEAENQGQTTMLVCDGDRVRGFIAVADTVREDSKEVIGELKEMGKQSAMLTGDNASVAQSIGKDLGIDIIESNLLPEEKVKVIRSLGKTYGAVAMIGDGINDTPALAAASLGIAMGGAGSAQAMETADIVLMADDLKQLPFAVKLSTFTRKLIRENVIFSLGIKLGFVLLAMTGLTSLWLAVLADVGVSLAVTTNGLRANRYSL
jgi:Cd2+/Zn2+-exporting ATPase